MSVQRQRQGHSSPVPGGLVLPRLATRVFSQTVPLVRSAFSFTDTAHLACLNSKIYRLVI